MATKRLIAALLVISALLTADSGFSREKADRQRSAGLVKHVLDGDTIILDTGEKVRYLGIDAPEVSHDGEPSECYARKAKEANSRMVFGKRVTLRYASIPRDRYGRLLAYVIVPDGTCANLELVRSGNACLYTKGEQLEMLPDLMAAQREAIKQRRGMWEACRVKPSPFYRGNSNTHAFHRSWCPLGVRLSARNRTRFPDRWSALLEGFHPCRRCKP
ncbi:MAG: thermonuclease family protein [Syntrophobacteraceae bacterium]